MSNYVLLSHVLKQNIPTYGNRDKFIIRANSTIAAGCTANSNCWIFSNNHIGTHVDVPRHFSDIGKKTVDYPIDDWIFEAPQIVDLQKDSACLLKPSDFEDFDINADADLLLIRTGFESKRCMCDAYWNDNPGLAPELADYFRTKFPKLRCVGFDFISVTSWKHRTEGRLAHQAFLTPEKGKKEIWCIEDMSLKACPSVLKKVVVAPLLVEDGNGTAVTIIAEY